MADLGRDIVGVTLLTGEVCQPEITGERGSASQTLRAVLKRASRPSRCTQAATGLCAFSLF